MILDYEKNFNDADFGIGNGIGLCKAAVQVMME